MFFFNLWQAINYDKHTEFLSYLCPTQHCADKSLLLYWTLPLWAPDSEIPPTYLHLQLACMGCTWALGQLLVQTSWVAVVWTPKCWGSQRNGWSPSAQAHGQGAHQCFWVAAKMGETLLESGTKKKETQLAYRSMKMEATYPTSTLFPLNPYLMKSWQSPLRRRKKKEKR